MIWRVGLVGLLVLGGAAGSRAGDWETDPDAARRVAARDGKDLFLLFTGTAWCGPCIEFEIQVLGKPEFLAGSTAFVRVKLEYPGNESEWVPDRRDPYIAWRDRYGIRAYPTVILADPTGRPYAVMGFDNETNPSDFIHKLDRLRPVRDRRDQALARAAQSQGLEKAQALDAALTAIRDASEPDLAVHHGEMVVRFYRPQIDEVIALDADNAAGLRDHYRRLLGTHDEQARLTQLRDRLTLMVRNEGAKAALAVFDAEMAGAPSSEFRSRLIISKLYLLEADKKFEEARALAEELATDATRSPAEHRGLRLNAAHDLAQLDRLDEAIKVYDELIAAAGGDRNLVYRTLSTKASTLTHRNPEEALRAWELARSQVPPGSQKWLDVEMPRLRCLRRLKRLDEALGGFDAVLALPALPEIDRIVCLADRAMTLGVIGRRDEALAEAARVDAQLPGIDQPENAPTITFIRSMLVVARRDPTTPKP